MTGLTAIVLAGSRPGGDPLAQAAGVPTKALAPIAGRPMVDYVVRTLVEHPAVARVLLMAQEPETILAHPRCAWMADDARVAPLVSQVGISQSLLTRIDDPATPPPLLVTTADNVLLSATMIDAFIAGVGEADVAVAMVERGTLLARYPESRRTWLKFRGGSWSGANLFWLGNVRARGAIAFWQGVEQDRKKGLKVIGAFGPLLLLGALLRLVTLPQGLHLAGRRFGLNAILVPMFEPEACIDADKPEDVMLIESILAARDQPR